MEKTCQMVEPLLAGYALNALDVNEKHLVEDHLETCLFCQEALADFRDIGDNLMFAVPPQDPPPYLRARLLRNTMPERGKESWLWHLRNLKLSPFQFFALIAIVLLALINLNLVHETGQLLRSHQAQKQQNQAYQTAFSLLTYPDSKVAVVEEGDVYGTLVYEPDGEVAMLNVRGLDKLPPGKDYQVWLIQPDQTRISGGIFDSEAMEIYISFVITSPVPMDSLIGIGVTVEPEGGSPGPTGPRLFGIEL